MGGGGVIMDAEVLTEDSDLRTAGICAVDVLRNALIHAIVLTGLRSTNLQDISCHLQDHIRTISCKYLILPALYLIDRTAPPLPFTFLSVKAVNIKHLLCVFE